MQGLSTPRLCGLVPVRGHLLAIVDRHAPDPTSTVRWIVPRPPSSAPRCSSGPEVPRPPPGRGLVPVGGAAAEAESADSHSRCAVAAEHSLRGRRGVRAAPPAHASNGSPGRRRRHRFTPHFCNTSSEPLHAIRPSGGTRIVAALDASPASHDGGHERLRLSFDGFPDEGHPVVPVGRPSSSMKESCDDDHSS